MERTVHKEAVMVRSLAKIVLVVTILLLAVPSSHAAEGRTEDRSGWGVARAVLSWSFFSDFWEVVSGVWTNNGCEMDPSGRCWDSVQRENGSILAPDGDVDSSWADNGCEFDPNGRCRS